MRAFAAIPIAIAICAAAPAFADAQSNVQAARKAEKRGEWHRALDAWKAAYAADGNAEYLIGIGDAYAKLGNAAEAKKNYQAYLADPLALPSNVEKVKAKIAGLEAPAAGALALPGPGLALPAASTPPPLPGIEASASNDKKGKKKDAVPPPLPLPGLDLPGSAPAQAAAKEPQLLSLPGLELPSAKKEPVKVASASPGLELPLPGATAAKPATPAKKEPAPAVASGGTKVVAAATAPPGAARRAPEAAIAEIPAPRGLQPEASSGTSRVVAYVAAGVALASLGGGVLAYTKASSAHSDLTGRVHSGPEAQGLLETERKNKTLSFVGLAGGLVSAGIATALFAF